jgi:ribonucleoside-diphosphate reductase beta chain
MSRAEYPHTAPAQIERWNALHARIKAANFAKIEPRLQADRARKTLMPLRDTEMWEFRKTIERLNWNAQEVVLDDDAADRAKVTPGEYRLLVCVLKFFEIADDRIMDGLDGAVARHLTCMEGAHYTRAQGHQEGVHAEAYGLQSQEALGGDPEIPEGVDAAVGRMSDWVRWCIESDLPPVVLFATMAFNEGALFSGMFAVLEWFKTRNLFPGVTQLNEFIVRDESVHASFWIFVVTKRLTAPAPVWLLSELSDITAGLSASFFADAMPAAFDVLSAPLLAAHTAFRARKIEAELGGRAMGAGLVDPLTYMDKSALPGKTNFMEKEVTQYQELGEGAMAFAIHADDTDDD